MSLLDLLPEEKQYYRYIGSLTTPPCAESVVWTVLKSPLNVTQQQLDRFRSLRERDGSSVEQLPIANNFRDPQPLYARSVQVFNG